MSNNAKRVVFFLCILLGVISIVAISLYVYPTKTTNKVKNINLTSSIESTIEEINTNALKKSNNLTYNGTTELPNLVLNIVGNTIVSNHFIKVTYKNTTGYAKIISSQPYLKCVAVKKNLVGEDNFEAKYLGTHVVKITNKLPVPIIVYLNGTNKKYIVAREIYFDLNTNKNDGKPTLFYSTHCGYCKLLLNYLEKNTTLLDRIHLKSIEIYQQDYLNNTKNTSCYGAVPTLVYYNNSVLKTTCGVGNVLNKVKE